MTQGTAMARKANDDSEGILVIDGTAYETTLPRTYTGAKPHRSDPKQLHAYIPGVVLKVHVTPGQRVERGTRLIVLEAMKMQNELTAPISGVIKTIHVAPGDMVAKGQLILEFE